MNKKTIFIIIIWIINSAIASVALGGLSLNKKEIPESNIKARGIFIGVNNYKEAGINPLAGSLNDAMLLYNKTSEHFADSMLLYDTEASRKGITRALLNTLNKSKKGDIFLFYMASHGSFSYNDYYFWPHDSELKNILGTAIAFRALNGVFLEFAKKGIKVIVIMDTCYSGGATLDIRDFLISNNNSEGGISYLTSADINELAAEKEFEGKYHGLFTFYVGEGLSGKADLNKDKSISLRELYEYVYNKVKKDSNGKQHPILLSSLPGATIVVGRKTQYIVTR